jgi:hypothetical protein
LSLDESFPLSKKGSVIRNPAGNPFLLLYAVESTLFTAGSSAEKRKDRTTHAALQRIGLKKTFRLFLPAIPRKYIE